MEDRVEHLWGPGKVILGPMVRASSLPLRLAALEYGADVVYSEEIPAHRAAHKLCVREANPVLGTVDFVEKKEMSANSLVLFRTHVGAEVEAGKCVLQLSCTDAITAVRAAQVFQRDVAAIDINMGCAKHYSVSRGAGSALMHRPEIAADILKTLRRNITIPVSIKTRLHNADKCECNAAHATMSGQVDVAKTTEWLQHLQMNGAQAITVHMRTSAEKNRDEAHWELFRHLHDKMRCSNTPLVYNGDIWSREDILRVRNSISNHSTGKEEEQHQPDSGHNVSVMVSRAGLWDPSVFRELKATTTARISPESQRASVEELLQCITKHSIDTANCPRNTRYLLQQILAGARQLHSPVRQRLLDAHTMSEVAEAVGCGEYAVLQWQRQTAAWASRWKQPTISTTAGSCDKLGTDTTTDLYCNSILTSGNGAREMETVATQHNVGAANNRTLHDDHHLRAYFNSSQWPGIICQTSHDYSDRYFDDNYYIAFCRPSAVVKEADRSNGNGGGDSGGRGGSGDSGGGNCGGGNRSVGGKRGFVYAGFSEATTTVVRIKKGT